MHVRVGFGALLLLAGCASGGGSGSGVRGAVPPARADTSPSGGSGAVADARIAVLKRSFDCVDVPSASAFVCSMKDGIVGSLVRKRIEPVVTSSGHIFLRSVYRDRDWIYHDHVEVRIGDVEMRTEALAATSPDVSRREVRRESSRSTRNSSRSVRQEERYVAEVLSFRSGNDNGIVRAVARAGDAPVAMRLAGGPRQYDKVLSSDEKRLFAEAQELATLLRARGGENR